MINYQWSAHAFFFQQNFKLFARKSFVAQKGNLPAKKQLLSSSVFEYLFARTCTALLPMSGNDNIHVIPFPHSRVHMIRAAANGDQYTAHNNEK